MLNRLLCAGAMLFAASALFWTAVQHSGVHAGDWYVSSCLIGCSAVFAANVRSRLLPFPRWLRIAGLSAGAYLLLQLIPLPAGLLRVLDPARAAMLSAAARVVPGAGSAPIALDQPAAILWTATLLAGVALFFAVRRVAAVFRQHPWLVLLPLFCLGVVEAVLGFFQLTGGAPYITGTYNSRDHYSFLLEITVPLLAAAGLASMRQGGEPSPFSAGRAIITCAFWGCALLLVGITFSTLSRTGAFGALMGLAVFVSLATSSVVSSRAMRIGLVSALAAAVGLALFAFTPHALLQRLFESGTESDVRLSFWRQSLPLLGQFPLFGIGLMGYESAFLRYQNVLLLRRVDFAHNDYLQYLIELGVIGFLLCGAVLAGVLWPPIQGAWKSPDLRTRVWLTGCAGAFAAAAVHSFVDFNLYVPANVLAFAWIAAFASAMVSAPAAHFPVRRRFSA